MAARQRSQSRDPEGNDVADPSKQEFIANLHSMIYFYNRLQKITPQFNPLESHVLKPHEMVQSSV